MVALFLENSVPHDCILPISIEYARNGQISVRGLAMHRFTDGAFDGANHFSAPLLDMKAYVIKFS